jgi:CelD/BcsL family acetyltransferase involved in cellulose biosynthesis
MTIVLEPPTARAPAAPAPRRAFPDIVVEVRRASELAEIEPHWRALFVEAAEPNPFFGPDFLQPLARLRGGRFHVALAWRQAGGSRALVGLLPFAPVPGLPLVRPPLLRAFGDPFVANATPLVGAHGADLVLERLVAELARTFPRSVLLLEPLRLGGPIADALAHAGRPHHLARSIERAAIRAELPSGDYLATRIAGKRVRELRRCEKRLAEAGSVETRTLWGAAAAPALDAFLSLEASGWKGRQGTALASRPRLLAFAREALSGTAPGVAADLMTLDGKPVAAALHLVAGAEAVAFKCAYDESWAKASPGALLDVHTLLMTLDTGQLSLMDSGALPGHPVEALWRERIAFGRMLVDLRRGASPGGLASLAGRLEGIERATGALKTRIKGALGRKTTALRPS